MPRMNAPDVPGSSGEPEIDFDLPDEELRLLGHRVVDLMIEAIRAERSDPVLAPVSGPELKARLDEALPETGASFEDLLTVFRDEILPHCRHNGHPRFFGYVCTSADPLGMLADLLASAINQPVTAWRSAPSATAVERQLVRWLHRLTGFEGEGGLLVSGGSAANFHGLACAVTEAERRAGLPPGSRHRLTVHLSREGHVSLRKAAQLLGIPPRQVHILDVDKERRLVPEALRQRLARDMDEGLVPAAVCASAGTANAGTIDPLEEIADLCAEHRVWLHIDGAYGAPAVLTEDYRWMAETFARADSMSLDPHKWLFAPADAGCVLVRDDETARRAFMLASEYTEVAQTDPVERYAFFDHGFEMSRRFRGLKVWAILKTRGTAGLRSAIGHDIALRRYLDERIAAEPRLEALASELSIACFRYRPAGMSGERAAGETSREILNEINRSILETLVEEGGCYLSPTTLEGRYALRVCIVNFRTRREDIDFLVDEILRIGDGLDRQTTGRG